MNPDNSNETLVCALGNLRAVAGGLNRLEKILGRFKGVTPLSAGAKQSVDSMRDDRESKKEHLRTIFEKIRKGQSFAQIGREYGRTAQTVKLWFTKAQELNEKGWLYPPSSKQP